MFLFSTHEPFGFWWRCRGFVGEVPESLGHARKLFDVMCVSVRIFFLMELA